MVSSQSSLEYPERPQFFILKLIDVLEDQATTIGREVCWLLTVIARTEDRLRYAGPVGFWNKDLKRRVGMTSNETFAKTRAKAVKAGWLQYVPGTRAAAPRYFVTIPAGVLPTTSGTHDDSIRTRSGTGSQPDQGQYRTTSGTQSTDLNTKSGTPSVLHDPIPKTRPKTRGSKSGYSWKALTAETMLAVVKADSPDEFMRWDSEGVQAFGWTDSEVARRNRLCLWVSSLRTAKAKGGNAAALLTSALKAGRMGVITSSDEDAARSFLRRGKVAEVVQPMPVADHQTADVAKLEQFQTLALHTLRRPPATIVPPIRATRTETARSA